jgi:hypothetical protein
MKNISLFFAILVFVISFVSCSEDAEHIPENQKFEGIYIGSTECDGIDGFDATIEIIAKDNSNTDVIVNVKNFGGGIGNSYEGKIKEPNIELFLNDGSNEVVGLGSFSRNTLTINILFFGDSGSFTCKYTCTK